MTTTTLHTTAAAPADPDVDPAAPVTGREMGRRRLALGLSRFATARALGVHTATLATWERMLDPLPPARRERWDAALCHLARERVGELAHQGWAPGELPASMRTVLRLYTTK